MSNQFPPPDFVQTPSAVPGIIVYRPRPPEETHQEVVEFTCPQCAASKAYSAENGGLTCTFCGYNEKPAGEVLGRGAEEFEFTVETVERAAHGWGQERKELVCNNCSAHTTFSIDMLTHTCPFCASNQVMQVKAPQDVLRPRFLIPFKTTEDECRAVAAGWLGNSWMLPQGLQQLARTAPFTPIYIPYWTFDANIAASWRAQVAHQKQRTVWVNGKRTTRTETVWKWESGSVSLFIDDMLVNGSSRLSALLLKKVRQYQLDALVAYDPTFLAGIQAQAYDVALEPAWEQGRQGMREYTKSKCKAQATSQRMRNFSMSLDFSNESWRYILLPIYLSSYQYGEQSYQVVVNGQSGVIAGQRPVDWQKVLLAMGAAFSPVLLLGVLTAVLLNAGVDWAGLIGVFTMVTLAVVLFLAIRWIIIARALDDI